MNHVWQLLAVLFLLIACESQRKSPADKLNDKILKGEGIPVIFDTDANNELDDQHALAYLLFNSNVFEVIGVTVNATMNGGDIKNHYTEAERILKLCTMESRVPLFAGANADFETIRPHLSEENFDGKPAVDFIIRQARMQRRQKLLLLPVGKLTNIALALAKAADIKEKVRIVWLGSNYPDPGEYNLINDIPALNYILNQDVRFEMVTVRYDKLSGSDAVRATAVEIEARMPASGPACNPVEGRHGGRFTHFGDYSVDLFRHAKMYGDPPSRALFDMVAVAVVKNPGWGESRTVAVTAYSEDQWVQQEDHSRKIIIWENFNGQAILQDFFKVMHQPVLK